MDNNTKVIVAALKDISAQLKTINRNVNYLGRKLEETNKILQKNGMAVFAELDTTKEPPSYGEQVAEEITQKCL